MTPDKEVYEALSASGIPGTKVAWQEGMAPPLPWFTYQRKRKGEVFAENSNYSALPRYEAELYIRENDTGVREAFEEAVASIGPYTAYETWIPTEQCLEVSYAFTYHYLTD